MKKRNVYTKVKRSSVPKGEKVIRVRWIDVNKCDAKAMDVRSRLVAMDFKDSEKPELFAGTPPLESLRILCSSAATVDEEGEEENVMMVSDVRRAYCYAPVERPIWIELPPEDKTTEDIEQDMVGQLNFSLYGTRDAALNWQGKVSKHLSGIGFSKGAASGCLFQHSKRNIKTLVHGDDCVSVGKKRHVMAERGAGEGVRNQNNHRGSRGWAAVGGQGSQ